MNMNDSSHSPRIFIGREKELDLLEKWFHDKESQHWFMVLTGGGGVGKSQLLEHFADKERSSVNPAMVTSHIIDLYWTAHQTEIGILRSLASQLAGPDGFVSFNKILSKNEPSRDISDEVRDAFFDGYKRLDQKSILLLFDTLEVASDSAIRFFLQTAPQLKSINSGMRILTASRPPLPIELVDSDFVKLLPLDGLTFSEFSECVRKAVEGRKVPEDTIKRVHTTTNGKPIWAGLLADWINYGNDPSKIDTSSFEAFKENVLQPISVPSEPEDTIILAMAHLSRRCNEQILSHVLSGVADRLGIEIPQILEDLSGVSFVKYKKPIGDDTGVCLLHDEMRDLVYDLLQKRIDPWGSIRKDWSRKAVEYYDNEIQQLNSKSQASLLDFQVLNAERLYYSFHLGSDEAFDRYQKLFAQAKSTDVLEELNEEVDAARKAFKIELSPPNERRYILNEALVDHRRERYVEAIEKFNTLNNDSQCETELLANARWRLVMAHTLIGELQNAIDMGIEWTKWLQEKIQNTAVNDDSRKTLTRQLASLHSQLGQAYRKQGNAKVAVETYNRALNLYYQSDSPHDEVANTRINLVGAYLELGLELGLSGKALEQCKAAYRAYKVLDDPYHLGRVHNVWGLIHDGMLEEDKAKEHFDKALQYFRDARNRRGQGMCQVAQARMIRRELSYQEKHKEEKLSVEQQEGNYKIVNDLLDAAIANLKGRDLALLAIAFNEKGTLLRERKRFDEAIQLFNESNKIAGTLSHKHRLADNLQDMAQTFYQKNEFDKAIEFAEKAIDCGYPQPSGRARRTIADVLFDRQDYDGAFEAICHSCTEIVQLDTGSLGDGPLRRTRLYEEWIDWVVNLLLKLPTVEERDIRRRQLIKCWNKGTINGEMLSVAHPDFISALENLVYDDKWNNTHNRG